MANGDAAAAAGLATFASTQDIRLGYDNDNIRGDELAAHLTAGTHPASAINSGVLDVARIPAITADKVPSLDTSKVTSGVFDLARIPTLDTSRIPNLSAAKITSGTLTTQVITTANCSFGSVGAGSCTIDANPITNLPAYQNAVSGLAVYISSSGVIGKGASTRRVKKEIKDADLDLNAVLGIQVRNFRYKSTMVESDGSVQIGVIAEELEELGLNEFVFYDENGAASGVHYEKLALALIPVVKNHEERLAALEGKLS